MRVFILINTILFLSCARKEINNLTPNKQDCFWELRKTYCNYNEYTQTTLYTFKKLKVNSVLKEGFINICNKRGLDYKVASDSTFLVSAYQVPDIESMHILFSGGFKYDSTLIK